MNKKILVLLATLFIIINCYAENNNNKPFKQFDLNVSDVNVKMLNSDFWISKLKNPKQILMNKSQIDTYNKESFKKVDVLVDLNNYPSKISKDDLLEKINHLSSIPKYDRFFEDGTKLTPEIYNKYTLNLNKNNIKSNNNIKFGLAIKRSPMRTFPVDEVILNSGMNKDIDRFQESAIFPGEGVAILHESLDKKWLLVQKYNYLAWVKADSIAIGDRSNVLSYINESQNILVVTGKNVRTVYNPEDLRVSNLLLDMGLKFPLETKTLKYVDGRNHYTGYVIKMPTREKNSQLKIKDVMIPRNEDVHIGYLPFNTQNILVEAFKLLGERYGWGNRYGTRDCTGFTLSVYNTFGIVMTRNSSEQGKKALGPTINLKDLSLNEQSKILNSSTIGDEIYMSGHVMLYIGSIDGKTYIIHDTESSDLGLKGVSITTIDYLHKSFDRLKTFRL